MPDDKPVARRVKKKRKRKRKSRVGEKNKGVGCLKPSDQRKHLARDNKYRAFATEYLRTMSVAAASRAIGLKEKTLASGGWQYLRKPAIQKIIQEEMSKRADAAGVTQERVINELAALAFSVITDFVAFDGKVVHLAPSTSLTREQAAAVQSVQSKHSASGLPNVSIKMYDKLKALEILARIKGMVGDDGKNLFGSSDVRSTAERLMSAVEQARAKTSPSAPPEGEPKDA
jgi:phage terminase small subunit